MNNLDRALELQDLRAGKRWKDWGKYLTGLKTVKRAADGTVAYATANPRKMVMKLTGLGTVGTKNTKTTITKTLAFFNNATTTTVSTTPTGLDYTGANFAKAKGNLKISGTCDSCTMTVGIYNADTATALSSSTVTGTTGTLTAKTTATATGATAPKIKAIIKAVEVAHADAKITALTITGSLNALTTEFIG